MSRKLFDDRPCFWESSKVKLEVIWLLIQIFSATIVATKLAQVLNFFEGLIG